MNDLIAKFLFVIFLLLILASYYFGVRKRGRKIFITFLYLLTIVYTIIQGVYYAKNFPGSSPDESAHISYVYYLDKTGEIIPHFEDMQLFNVQQMKWSIDYYAYEPDTVNYLCHPPLYYQIMRLAGGFSETEDPTVIQIDKMRLRYFSMGIYTIGLALLLYIGWSRISKAKPWLHLIYATACSSIPMLAFEFCAVTNDSLALVAACICFIGLIRFCENKRGYLTYILIAVGITASLLNKMTGAMLCIIMALIVLAVTMIKERSIKDSLRKEFFITLPIYFIAVAYFAVMYSRYGVLRPSLELISSPEYFRSTIYYKAESERANFDLAGYLDYYFNQFFLSWSGIASTTSYMKLTIFTKASIPTELLWIIPIMVFVPAIKKVSGNLSLPIIAGWVSTILTFAFQLKSAYGTFLSRGYLGGFQARYYIPMMFIFGLGTSFVFQGLLLENGFDSETEVITIKNLREFSKRQIYNQIIYYLGLFYCFMMFYSNFPFFLMHFA